MQRGSQLAFERFGQRAQLFCIAAAHDQAGGAEDLVVQRRLRLEALGIGHVEAGLPAVGLVAALPARDAAHVCLGGQLVDAARVGAVDTGGEHRLCSHIAHGGSGSRFKDIQFRPIDGEQQTRVRTELACTHRQRRHVLLTQRSTTLGQCIGQQEHGVDGAQLAIHGNRLRACLRNAQQRQTASSRTGKADGLDTRIRHQCARHIVVGHDEREHAFRQPTLRNRGLNGTAHQFGRTRVRRMRLHDHRATGCQRRCGIATRHRERQREVARTEHGHRAERNAAHAQVRARQRLAFRQGRIKPRAHGIAGTHHACKQAQLVARAATLAFQARTRQGRLGHRAFDQRIAQRFDLAGDGFQEGSAGFRRGLAVNVKSRGGQFSGTRGLGLGGQGEFSSPLNCIRIPCVFGCAQAASFSTSAMRDTNVDSSAISASVRSVNGARTGPASRPMTFIPALTIDTA
ncbi:hypothetical protein COLO4_01895 [Corchorus olitorius]|uniref:Uncharacterized protein n=1 Tax=Corchorus olitorius TaxID=93759 RepID=A0A1R3L1U1_9ROSI|nr:hypothetical protein COLO4_01895 [Corchorus olitorius]